MATTAINTIKAKVAGEQYVIEEIKATAVTIKPGSLLEFTSGSLVQVNSASGLDCERIFALEDELQGKKITENYAASARVQCWFPQRGDQVYALLANGESVSIGAKLVSNGDGTLKALVGDSSGTIAEETLLAIALEAVDMSGSDAVDPDGRIKVRII